MDNFRWKNIIDKNSKVISDVEETNVMKHLSHPYTD